MCHEIDDGAVIPFDKNFGGLIACVGARLALPNFAAAPMRAF